MEQKIFNKNITVGFLYIQVLVAVITYFLLSLLQLTNTAILAEIIIIVLITTSFFYFIYNGKIIIDIDGLQIDRCWYPIDKISSLHISFLDTDYTGTMVLLNIQYHINTTEIWKKIIQLNSYDKEIEGDLKKWCTVNKIPFHINSERKSYRND